MHAVLKDLDLDYALCEEKPIAPSVIHEDYVNKMREHTVSLVKWMTSNELTKLIIKQTISVELMEVLPDKKNNRELTVKEFYKSIDLYFKKKFLIKSLFTSHYDGQIDIGEHIRNMVKMAHELNVFGVSISDDSLVQFISSSLPCNYYPPNSKIRVVYEFCKSLRHIKDQCVIFKKNGLNKVIIWIISSLS